MAYDLHVHTTASDGIFTPSQIVDWGLREGLDGLAITDHDTVDGLEQAIRYSKDKNLRIIPGIELSCEYENPKENPSKTHSIHMLGYFFDYHNSDLLGRLTYLQAKRLERAKKMIEILHSHGVTIDKNIVNGHNGSGSIGRPAIARQMIAQGYAENMTQVFENWLSEGKPAYVPRVKISPFEAIDMIRSAGGVAVFAHPVLAGCDGLIGALAAYGLAGLEVYHPKHSQEDIKGYLAYCIEYNLAPTGGSDCHEAYLGKWGIEKDQVEQLKNLVAK